jgi:hypothetical protein
MSTRTRKFLGLDGGTRRRRQDPIAWVALSVIATALLLKVAVVAALHLSLSKGVSR